MSISHIKLQDVRVMGAGRQMPVAEGVTGGAGLEGSKENAFWAEGEVKAKPGDLGTSLCSPRSGVL